MIGSPETTTQWIDELENLAPGFFDRVLADIDVLPQNRLDQLAARGVILSVMTFEDHMHPQVHWIEPEEFGRAFEMLTRKEPDLMTEAAHTNGQPSYPGYVNIQRDEAGAFVLTVRGDPTPLQPPETGVEMGATVCITLDEMDFHQLIANAQRMSPGAVTPVGEIEPVIEELAADREFTDDEKADMKHEAQMADLEPRTEEEAIESKPIPEDVVHEPDAIVVDQIEGEFQGDAWPGAAPK